MDGHIMISGLEHLSYKERPRLVQPGGGNGWTSELPSSTHKNIIEMQGKGHDLKQKRFRLDKRKHLLTIRTVE